MRVWRLTSSSSLVGATDTVLGLCCMMCLELCPGVLLRHLVSGDISLHHPAILHGSGPNLSDSRRCGLNIRYISTSTKVIQDVGDDLFLMRGSPVEGINKYRPWPKYSPQEHMRFQGCEEWNEDKKLRQGKGIDELGSEEEEKRRKLVCTPSLLRSQYY